MNNLDNNTTDSFDINNPNLAAEGAGIEGFDPNADSNAPPKPPAAGTYLLQLDFAEAEPEKRFKHGTKDDPSKDQLMTSFVATIVGYDKLAEGERQPEGRKIGGKSGFIVGSWAVRGQRGTSGFGDLLKAYGLKPRQLAALAGAGGQKRWEDTPVEELITDCILSGTPVRAYCDWEWAGSTKELVDPNTGKPYYIRFDYKDDQLKNVPQGMKAAKDDGKGGKLHQLTFHFQSPDGEGSEDVQLFASLKVERFMPPKAGQ